MMSLENMPPSTTNAAEGLGGLTVGTAQPVAGGFGDVELAGLVVGVFDLRRRRTWVLEQCKKRYGRKCRMAVSNRRHDTTPVATNLIKIP